MMLWRLFSSISLMRSACVVRTRFILNNFSGIEFGGPRTPVPPGYAHGYSVVCVSVCVFVGYMSESD